MILSPLPVRSQIESEDVSDLKSNYDRITRKGEPAKFTGVLVPHDVYKYYRAETIRAGEMDLQLIESEDLLRKTSRQTPNWLIFLGGVFIGTTGLLLMQKK